MSIISKPWVNSNWGYSLEKHNLGHNQQYFFCPVQTEIWQMTLKNNRAPLHYIKFVHHFKAMGEIQSRVTARKGSIQVKKRPFFVTCYLEIWQMTLKNNGAPFKVEGHGLSGMN